MKFRASTARRSIIAAVWAASAWGISAAPSAKSKATVPKYFHENRYDVHYDDRYSRILLEDPKQREAIKVLVQTYLATFRDLGVQTWLMHGTLLGWWWGKKVMPWDYDADVQVTEADMYFLAAYHNMTTYYYKYGDMEKGRFFQLEVNPYFVHREQDDKSNVIDARWIDMQNGLYIDITAARYALDHPEGEGVLYDKFGHEYRDTYVFPLRDTTFEGVPCKIPYRYEDMLQAEYGRSSLTNTEYHGHRFDNEAREWVPIKKKLEEELHVFAALRRHLVLHSNKQTGRQNRADRLNERLRGAQRANVDDESFNLGIDSLDIGSLVIASSIASNSSPAVRTKYSPTTSAKRRKLDKDVPPQPEPRSSSTPRRRGVRSQLAEPPVELPVLSREAEMRDVTAPEQEDEEDDEPTPRPGRTFQVPHSSSSVRTAARHLVEEEEEAEDELETLPPHPSAISAALLRSPTTAREPENIIEEVTESPADAPGSGKRRRVPMSETLSSTARLMGVISSDDGMPMPSSPLASKVRRSDATTVRSARSAGTIYGQETSDLADELSSDNFPQLAGVEPIDEGNEATDLAMEDNTFAQEEDGEEEEYRLEEQEHADEIDEGKVARILEGTARRPRGPSPELGSQDMEDAEQIEEEEIQPEHEPEPEPESEAESEPEMEVATEAEEEEEEATVLPTPPKRKRGRPSKSPTTQKQPIAKAKPVGPRKRAAPRPQEYNDENDENEEPQAKKSKPKTKKRHSDQSEGDGGTIEITVQRFVNLKKRGNEDDDEDPLQSEMAFVNHGGESVIDVFAQVCDEVISSTLEQFQEVASGAEDPAKKKEYRIKMRAIEAYREELKSRFLQHAIHLNHWHSLRKRVRHVQKERMALREEIMRIKAEREQVALRMDAIRIRHEADARESKYCLDASSLMHDVDLAVEQGREAPELSRAAQKEAELANLELLVSRVSEQASSSSFTGGILKQVKDFNSFLERAAMALESR
ncbi:Protein MNN4 [Trichoderma ghanense]|uniref:Protein MNN4 n=1 Tax=Trichoderma ghanense TaxID=65468 RepID=A0ABY2HHG7_9HYPO